MLSALAACVAAPRHCWAQPASLQVRFGYLRELPPDYTGERHVVTLGRLPDGNYQWEERPGLAPANEDEDCAKTIIRINLVEAKHGQHEPAAET